MYIPFLSIISYVLCALFFNNNQPLALPLNLVFQNIICTEVVYFSMMYWLEDVVISWYVVLFRFVMIELFQETYVYFSHRFFHRYLYHWHKSHHQTYGTWYAWHNHIVDHLCITLTSVVLPIILFPIPKYLLNLYVVYGICSSVNGHTGNSNHSIHHMNPAKRFGDGFHIWDKILDSYDP